MLQVEFLKELVVDSVWWVVGKVVQASGGQHN